jgi:hypothetical protein
MCTSLWYIVFSQMWTLCDVSLSMLMFLCTSMSWFICVHYDLLLKLVMGFRASYLLSNTICKNRLLYLLRVTVRPSLGTSVCHCGISQLTIDGILWRLCGINLQKCFVNFPHFGKSNEYAGQYIVRPEHIWHVCDLSTNISSLGCGDRLLILK